MYCVSLLTILGSFYPQCGVRAFEAQVITRVPVRTIYAVQIDVGAVYRHRIGTAITSPAGHRPDIHVSVFISLTILNLNPMESTVPVIRPIEQLVFGHADRMVNPRSNKST
jgi:hypothetical protein